MPALADSQAAFAAALLDPARPAPFDVARPGSPRAPSDQTKRFDVYRNNVYATAVDALAENFPAVQRLVGEEFLRAVARAYLDVHPPRSPILVRLGDRFANFLDTFPPAAAVPYLGDVARLEQARIDAYHAADADPMPISALAEFPAEAVGRVVLTPHPAMTLVRSRHPIGSIWGASTDTLDPAQVTMTEAEDVLITRPALAVETAILPTGGGAFLNALLENRTIERAADLAAAEVDGFDLSNHLSGLFAAGAFIAATVAADGTDHGDS
jgi:hypothetical protein